MKLNKYMAFVANDEKAETFKKWCKESGTEWQVLIREVIEAIPEGRVKIQPKTATQIKNLKELYNDTSN